MINMGIWSYGKRQNTFSFGNDVKTAITLAQAVRQNFSQLFHFDPTRHSFSCYVRRALCNIWYFIKHPNQTILLGSILDFDHTQNTINWLWCWINSLIRLLSSFHQHRPTNIRISLALSSTENIKIGRRLVALMSSAYLPITHNFRRKNIPAPPNVELKCEFYYNNMKMGSLFYHRKIYPAAGMLRPLSRKVLYKSDSTIPLIIFLHPYLCLQLAL